MKLTVAWVVAIGVAATGAARAEVVALPDIDITTSAPTTAATAPAAPATAETAAANFP